MNYAGKVYSSDILVGHVCANSMSALKRKASILCNRYNKAVDTLVLHQSEGKEVDNLKLTRTNKLSQSKKVIRGTWKM